MAKRLQRFMPNRQRQSRAHPRSIRPAVHYSPTLDDFRRYITDAPTPEKLALWLRSVDDGDIAALCELTDEMLAKDAHLMGVVQTRRGAVTALDWEIEPNPDDPDLKLAEEKADYCTERLSGIPNFSVVLDHLATAIGPNVAVVELLWDRAEITGLVSVPGHRLTGDPVGQKPGVFVETEESMGIPTTLGKWIVYHPQPNGGFPFRMTLTHTTVFPWLMTHFSRSDWMSFSELYGNPMRVAHWTDDVPDGDRETAQEMLDRMDSDTAASLPVGIDVDLLQASGTGETFEKQVDWAERKMSIAWLGQTLTTDTGRSGGGAFALGKVHDHVRGDILAMDLKSERRTIEQQLLGPMVGLRFPEHPGPTPVWRRVFEESRDFDAERVSVEKLEKAIAMGVAVKVDEVYSILGIERPADDETDVIGEVRRAETPETPEA